MRLLVFILVTCSLLVHTDYAAAASLPGEIKIGSWHIRKLSDRSRDDAEITKIADMISKFDLVALQGVMDEIVLARIKVKLYGWTFMTSVSFDSTNEGYAFFWNAMNVSAKSPGFVVGDPHDRFAYDPYVANFRCGEFDFTMINVRLSTKVAEVDRRKLELASMPGLIDSVQHANGDEQDVILVGNFYFSPTDNGWNIKSWSPTFLPPEITTVGVKMLSDNIWLQTTATHEFTGSSGIIKFDEIMYKDDHVQAILDISDHRPIWATFKTTIDDDDHSRLNYPVIKE